MDKIIGLKLHETVAIQKNIEAMRVPGGLIYTEHAQGPDSEGVYSAQSSVFVPFTGFNYGDNKK